MVEVGTARATRCIRGSNHKNSQILQVRLVEQEQIFNKSLLQYIHEEALNSHPALFCPVQVSHTTIPTLEKGDLHDVESMDSGRQCSFPTDEENKP